MVTNLAATAIGMAAALVFAGGCASLLGATDVPVPDDGGDAASEAGLDATRPDGAADSETDAICTDQAGCAAGGKQPCNVYGTQTCVAGCTWGACSCPRAPVCGPGTTQQLSRLRRRLHDGKPGLQRLRAVGDLLPVSTARP